MADRQDKPSALRRAREKAAQALAAEREKAAAIESALTELFVSRERAEAVIARAAERRDEAIAKATAKANAAFARAVGKVNARHAELLGRLRELGLGESELVAKTGLTLGEVRKLLRAAPSSGAAAIDSGEFEQKESAAAEPEPLGENSGGSSAVVAE